MLVISFLLLFFLIINVCFSKKIFILFLKTFILNIYLADLKILMSTKHYRDSSRKDRFYSWRDRIVFVSNIPFHYKAQDVMIMLRQFGRCFRVDLARNANGKSRGFAFIEFETREGAALAAEYLDGAQLDDRFLRAEISQFPPDELVEM